MDNSTFNPHQEFLATKLEEACNKKLPKLKRESSLDELLAELSVDSSVTMSPEYKKHTDQVHKIYAAVEARAKYLEKRKKARKRTHGPSRKTLADHKNYQPEAYDFGLTNYIITHTPVIRTIHRFVTTGERVALKVERAIDVTGDFLITMLETIQSEKFKYMALTNGSLTLLKWGVQKPTFFVLLLDIIQLFVTTFSDFVFMTTKSILASAQELLEHFTPSSSAQQVQGGEGFEPEAIDLSNMQTVIPVVASVVSLLATALIGQQVIAAPHILKSVKAYGDLGRATNGIKNLAENAMNLTTWIMDSVSALIMDYRGRSLVSSDSVCKELNITDEFMKEVETLIDPEKFLELMRSKEYLPRLSSARRRLLQFTGMRGEKRDPTLRQYIMQRVITLDKIMRENNAQFIGKGGSTRLVPFCIQLVGKPGEGKSTVMTPLANALLSEEGSGRVFENTSISSMSGVTKYWDGFRGEVALAIDDAFMTRGSQPSESEYTRFMTLISCVSMTVPKADLQSKGLTADSVRLVVLSSNCEKPNAGELNNSDAMLRRRHLVLRVSRTAPDNNPHGRVDPLDDHCRFMRRNPFTQTNMGNWMTYSEMLFLASDLFKFHLDEQEGLIEKGQVPVGFFTHRIQPKDHATPESYNKALLKAIDASKAPIVPECGFKKSDLDKPQEFENVHNSQPAPWNGVPLVTVDMAKEIKNLPPYLYREDNSEAIVFEKIDTAAYVQQSFDEWNFREEQPVYAAETYQPEIVVDHGQTRHMVPYWPLEPNFQQKREAFYYSTPNICCSIARIYNEKLYEWNYCNSTRTLATHNGYPESYLDMTVADFDYNSLTDFHREAFDEALDAGILLPPRSFVERFANPCEDEQWQAWEAIRIQERGFRQAKINQYNSCLNPIYRFHPNLEWIECDYDLAGPVRKIAHSGKILQSWYEQQYQGWDQQSWFSSKKEEKKEDEPPVPKEKENGHKYLALVSSAIAGVLLIFGGIRYFQIVKNYMKSSKVLIPNLNYDTQSMQTFIESAPEQYQGRLTQAISEAASAIQQESRVAYKSLMTDDGANPTKHIQFTPEGIVYDGSAKNVRALAMQVQSAFDANGIKTRSSADIVRGMCPEGLDENFSTQRALVVKNTVTFHKILFPEITALRGIGMRDRDVLVPHHFKTTFSDDEEIRISLNNVTTTFRFKHSMLRAPGNMKETHSDWAILRLPLTFNQFRDITHTLIREKDISRLDSNALIYFQRGVHSDVGYASLDNERRFINAVDDNGMPFEHVIARGLTYGVQTAKGDCGAPILLGDNTLSGIMAGFHIAGKDGRGMAQLMTREMYNSLSQNIADSGFERESLEHMTPFILTQDKQAVEEKKKIQNDENIPAWGLVSNAYANVPATRSKFDLSELTKVVNQAEEEFFPTNRAQATFSLEDPRVPQEIREKGVKPMSLSLNKYAPPPHTFPTRPFILAFTTILTVISTIVPIGVEKRLLNFSETLNGIHNFIAPIDVRTSVGFPYVKLTRGAPGKSALIKNCNPFGEQANYELNDDPKGPYFNGQLLSEYFKQRYDTVEEKIRCGIVPSYFAYENMKDELVSRKKIMNAKVRTFECLPLEISLLTRRYFGVFMGAMQQHCVDQPISVGINPTSLDWTLLFNRLTKFGEDSLIAGDYSNWDGKLMADVLLKCVEAINLWYNDGEENGKARIALALSFIHTDILVLNTLVRKRSGMPSGVPVTAPLNSLCNWFYILAAVVDMLEQQEFEAKTNTTITPQFLIDHIESAFYGDDHVVALSGILQKYINFKSFETYFANIGITYTDSQKRENTDFNFENIYQITYLKRRFLRDLENPKLIRAPLDINSITDMIVWTKKSPSATQIEVYKSRVRDFETSLAQHEQATYDSYIKIYNHAIDIVHQNKPHLAANYPKIYTPYSEHTQNFLKERR